jgi:hypothetical protein
MIHFGRHCLVLALELKFDTPWCGETLSPKKGSLESENKGNHYTWKDNFNISKNLLSPNAPWKKFLKIRGLSF